MTESDLINKMLKLKHINPNMKLSLGSFVDNDKKYLIMELPVSDKTYRKYLR